MFPIQEVRTYCKNYAVNAILSFYAEKAEKNGISMQVTIQMADPPVIPETEFCVLVGNLLENAVDACADTDAEIQSFIRLHVVQTGSSMLSITADNTSSGSPNWSGDKLLSTKHSGYGIGTESIRMIAERYSGDARFRWKDGIFYASVMLNLPEIVPLSADVEPLCRRPCAITVVPPPSAVSALLPGACGVGSDLP